MLVSSEEEIKNQMLTSKDAIQESSEKTATAIHDEVYQALRRFLLVLRLYGLFPVTETSTTSELKSVVNGLKFTFVNKWLICSFFALNGIVGYLYCIVPFHTLIIENPIESAMMTATATILTVSSFTHVVSSSFLSVHWPVYFKNWQTIDSLLDIKKDDQLRKYALTALIVFISFAVFSLVTALHSVVSLFTYDYDVSAKYPTGFSAGVMLYTVYVPACSILPEILFTCLCKAISIRIQLLTQRIIEIFDQANKNWPANDDNTYKEIEKMRYTYELLRANIKYTNTIMDIALLVSCIMNAGNLSIIIYLVLRQTLANFSVKMLKFLVGAMNLMRLIPVCISADRVNVEMRKLNRAIFQAPMTSLDSKSKDEVLLFIRFISNSPLHTFTALGLIHVNKGYINSVASAIVTYTFTLLQFDSDLKDSLLSNCLH